MSSARPQEEPETDAQTVYDDDEERLITERLQALGYIE
jgi:hypothetical protein